jgi:hypothetical protein
MLKGKRILALAAAFALGVPAWSQIETVTNSGSGIGNLPVPSGSQPAEQPASQDGSRPRPPALAVSARSWQTMTGLSSSRNAVPRENVGLIRVVQDAAAQQQQQRGQPTPAPIEPQSERVITRLAEVPSPTTNMGSLGMGFRNSRSASREPDDFVVSAEGEGGVVVSWRDITNNESSFEIQRRTWTGRAWGAIQELRVAANTESVLDRPGRGIFAYRVSSIGSGGQSRQTEWRLVEVSSGPTEPTDLPDASDTNNTQRNGNGNAPPLPALPDVPAGLLVTVGNDGALGVRWSAAANAERYEVERSPAFRDGLRVVTALEFTDAGLGLGAFGYRVRSVSSGGARSPYTDWVQASVLEALPALPGGLNATSVGDGFRVRVAWSDASDNEVYFVVQRETRGSASAFGMLEQVLLPRNTREYIDEPGPGVHRYRVAARNDSGTTAYGDWAEVVVVGTQPSPGDGPLPAVPTEVMARASGVNGVELLWQDNASDELRYEIERSPAFPTGRVRLPAESESYTDVTGAGVFEYRVRAVNGAGASAYSAWVTFEVRSATPAAPGSLGVTEEQDGIRVRLTWADNSANESGFRVEHQRREGVAWGATRTVIVRAEETSLIDHPGAGEHRYRIASQNAAGVSAYTAWETVTVRVPADDPQSVPPAAPGAASAIDLGNRRAAVAWADMSQNETGFEVSRDPAFPSGTITVSANTSGYVDDCGAGSYSYRVRAFNGAGVSEWTAPADVTVAQTAPDAPVGLRAMDVGNQVDVQVAWTDVSFNEDAFRVERETWASGSWGQATSQMLPANSAGYGDDPGLGKFRYRVQAINAGGNSAWTEWAVVDVTGGWTPIELAPGAIEIFVSSSDGNDANSGRSAAEPKRTLSAAIALLRDGQPDHLRLKRGDVWVNEQLTEAGRSWWKSGRSATEPMVVWSYGTASERPLIKSGEKPFGLHLQNSDTGVNHVWFVGVHFQANRRIPGPEYVQDPPTGLQSEGFRWWGKGSDVLLEDCKFEAFAGNLGVIGQDSGANMIRNVRVRRCVSVDAYAGYTGHSQGMYAESVDGLLVEECVFDHNGWSSWDPERPGTMFNHNAYINNSVVNAVFRNNIFARGSATGLMVRGRGTDAFNNLVLRNPIGISFAYSRVEWPADCVSGVIRYNVVLDSYDIAHASDSPLPRGFGLQWQFTRGSRIHNNIFAHDRHSRGGLAALSTDRPNEDLVVEDNIVYKWTGAGNLRGCGFLVGNDAFPASVVVRRNTFAQMQGGTVAATYRLMAPGGVFDANRYFSTSPNNEWFTIQDEGVEPAVWAQRANEPNLVLTQPNFPDPERTVETYMASLNRPGTLEAFLAEARQQSRTNWREDFTAGAVNRYIRQGFGMAEPVVGVSNN